MFLGLDLKIFWFRTMPKLSARNAERDICRLFACASFFWIAGGYVYVLSLLLLLVLIKPNQKYDEEPVSFTNKLKH